MLSVKRFLQAVVSVAALTAAALPLATAPASAAATPWQTGDPTFTAPTVKPPVIGVDYHPIWSSNDAATRKTMLDKYQAAGVGYVRIDLPWDNIETAANNTYNTSAIAYMDTLINEIDAHGMKTVVMLWKAPVWSSGTADPAYPTFGTVAGQPKNAADYGDALAWVGNRWGTKLAAVEMWNEPDQQSFWSNGSATETKTDRAVAYANMIKTAYPVAHAAAPTTKFILGAPSGLGLNDGWFATLYANGIAGNYDALGVHPYVQPSNTDPSTLPASDDWSTAGVSRVAAMMATYGDGAKKIWATEFGFSTHPNTGSEANWDRGVTESQQADYLLKSFQILGSIPQVEGAFVYHDRNYNDSNVQLANYGLLRLDLSAKPGYYALKCAASGVCGASAPAAPTGVTISNVTQSAATVSWTASAAATSYKVLRNGVVVGTPNATTFNDAGLAPSTTYTYTVVATNAVGDSAASAAVNATTLAASTTVPAAPTKVAAVPASSSSVNVTWTASVGATSYKVYRGGTLVGSTTGASFTNTGLALNTTYSYTVVASNTAGSSTPSTAVTVALKTPLQPSAVTWTSAGNGSATVTWTQNTGNNYGAPFTGYVLALQRVTSHKGTTWTGAWTDPVPHYGDPGWNATTTTIYTSPNSGANTAQLFNLVPGGEYRACIYEVTVVGKSTPCGPAGTSFIVPAYTGAPVGYSGSALKMLTVSSPTRLAAAPLPRSTTVRTTTVPAAAVPGLTTVGVAAASGRSFWEGGPGKPGTPGPGQRP